jgi:cation:H+ antiporter
VAALLRPLGAPEINLVDFGFMVGTAILLVPLIWTGRRLSRGEGALLLAIYVVYVYLLLQRTAG